jgi:hypothetical protein
MTIHWKALEEHLLMVPLVFRGENIFSEFFAEKPVLKELKGSIFTTTDENMQHHLHTWHFKVVSLLPYINSRAGQDPHQENQR